MNHKLLKLITVLILANSSEIESSSYPPGLGFGDGTSKDVPKEEIKLREGVLNFGGVSRTSTFAPVQTNQSSPESAPKSSSNLRASAASFLPSNPPAVNASAVHQPIVGQAPVPPPLPGQPVTLGPALPLPSVPPTYVDPSVPYLYPAQPPSYGMLGANYQVPAPYPMLPSAPTLPQQAYYLPPVPQQSLVPGQLPGVAMTTPLMTQPLSPPVITSYAPPPLPSTFASQSVSPPAQSFPSPPPQPIEAGRPELQDTFEFLKNPAAFAVEKNPERIKAIISILDMGRRAAGSFLNNLTGGHSSKSHSSQASSSAPSSSSATGGHLTGAMPPPSSLPPPLYPETDPFPYLHSSPSLPTPSLTLATPTAQQPFSLADDLLFSSTSSFRVIHPVEPTPSSPHESSSSASAEPQQKPENAEVVADTKDHDEIDSQSGDFGETKGPESVEKSEENQSDGGEHKKKDQ